MEAVQEEMNKTEITVLHAEDTGDDPYEPPIDKKREDTQFGDFFYHTPFTDKENENGLHCTPWGWDTPSKAESPDT